MRPATTMATPPGSCAAWRSARFLRRAPSCRCARRMPITRRRRSRCSRVADPTFTGRRRPRHGGIEGGSTPLASAAARTAPSRPISCAGCRRSRRPRTRCETVARLLGAGERYVAPRRRREREQLPRPSRSTSIACSISRRTALLPGELHCQAEPGLVLSPPATTARTTDDDGLLEASEIAGAQAQCRSRRAVGVQYRGERRPIRRRGACRAGRCLLQCRRAHRARQPLGSAVARDRSG